VLDLACVRRHGAGLARGFTTATSMSAQTGHHNVAKSSLLASRRREVADRWAFVPGAVPGETRTV
jgi:hypothetical protein